VHHRPFGKKDFKKLAERAVAHPAVTCVPQQVWAVGCRVIEGSSGQPIGRRNQFMALILLILLLAILLFGLGFAVHVLWWIALIVLVVWLLGFLVRVGEGGSRGRWYRWLPIGRARLNPI
jgi:cell division protein FtsW (lipid II flippase)